MGVNHVFLLFLLLLKVAFYRFKKLDMSFEIKPVKVGPHNRFPMGREN